VFTLFGNRVKHWFTFNEPIVPVEGGYLYDFHYPNVVDFKRAATVAYHTVLAHSTAVRAYRAGNYGGEIGVILNLTPSYPRSQHPADVKAAHHADLLFNRSFLDPVLKGISGGSGRIAERVRSATNLSARRQSAHRRGENRPARYQLLSAASREMS
jgi:beta-glucosidase/6-phospho-beta-glucosidase/beta-galactosidase